ncbi:MAG TPA: hypothetical protein VFG43_00850, partial [Geminicoccaceae bacterium]|nr:hypothetical protein [Geminicoccaceae bacterium]
VDSYYGAAGAVLKEAASEGVMRPVIALHEAEKLLSADEIRAGLARSPMVQAALQGRAVAPEEPKPNALRHNLVAHDDRTGTDAPFDDRRWPDMAARIDRAWDVIQTLFEPDRLDQAMADRPLPQVLVHSKGAHLGGLIGTRANYDDGTNKLHLAHNDPVEVIVHEFCHYLEESLPFDALGGTKHLLEDRAQGSRDLSNIFGPVMTDERMYSEGGSAFGRYGQKYYKDATEVLSMGGEYLSDPRTARQLVEQDPGLALMLLRVMRPTEYAQVMEHMLA